MGEERQEQDAFSDDPAYRELKEVKKELWLRREIARVMKSSSTPKELMFEILAVLVKGFGATGGSLYFMDREGRGITIKATYGYDPQYAMRYHHIQVGSHLTGIVAQTGEGLIIRDSQADVRVTKDVVKILNYRSAIVTPVTSGDDVIGIIALINEEPNQYNDNDLKMLELLGLHVSLLIVNSLLHEDIQKERSKLDEILDRVEEGVFEAELDEGFQVGSDTTHGALRMMEEARLTMFNPSFSRQCGDGLEVGSNLYTAFDRRQVLPMIRDALEDGEKIGIERRWSGEKERIFEVTLLRTDRGDLVKGIKGLRHDITQRAISERILVEQKERSELFLDILLHDVTNINTKLIDFIDKTTNACDLEEIKGEYIKGMLETIGRSSEMAKKILAMTSIQKDNPPMEQRDIRTSIEMARDILTMEGPLGEEIVLLKLPTSPMMVRCDELVVTLFRYLIGFGTSEPGGKVEIEARGWSYDEMPGYLITVDVRSRQIPNEIRDNPNEFWKGSLKHSAGDVSNLALAGNIINRYGGKIWMEELDNKTGPKGTRTMIFLPSS